MNGNIILFGGTYEGRLLAEYLNELGINCVLCVATDYGQEVLPEMECVKVRQGRLDKALMEELFMSESPAVVIDATHPYAELVTQNIKTAASKTGTRYIRLIRGGGQAAHPETLTYFEDVKSAANWLDKQEGNILLTTGLKELPDFADAIRDKSRIYARVLLREDVFELVGRYGLERKQIICMQGPFSRDLNAAMIRQLNAAFIVTKDSGKAGGFAEKADAAYETGAKCLVIRRPGQEEEGLSLEQVKEYIQKEYFAGGSFSNYAGSAGEIQRENLMTAKRYVQRDMARPAEAGDDSGNEAAKDPGISVTLIGIGMGDPGDMTIEARDACRNCGCIIGAKRMLNALSEFKKPMVSMYKSDEIFSYINDHPCYKDFVIALSGDPSFYSGAKKLLERLKDTNIRTLVFPGISSVSYFCARLNMSWDDMKIVSIHGREDNLIAAVLNNKKVFTLASYAQSIRDIAEELIYYGLGNCKVYIGCDLSYDTEKIYEGLAVDFADFYEDGICCAVIENENAGMERHVHGIPDDEFIRGKTPMTKEEVRSIAISKLSPGPSSVIYDIGAGTGSVSIECARAAGNGYVYAIEKNSDAIELLKENKRRFAASNIKIVEGEAPAALDQLPAPTHAFIGGSGGNLKEIADLLLGKNPHVRIVITCVTLETLAEAQEIIKARADLKSETVSVNISKSRKAGRYNLMTASNPVFIITLNKS